MLVLAHFASNSHVARLGFFSNGSNGFLKVEQDAFNDNDDDDDDDDDTLNEDVPNMCWASGPAGMSDGVMTPRTNIGISVERCWLKEVSGSTVRRQHTEICARVTNWKQTGGDKFDSVATNSQTDVKSSFHAGCWPKVVRMPCYQ